MTPPDLITPPSHLVDPLAPNTELLDSIDQSIFLWVRQGFSPDPLIDILLFLDNIIDLVAQLG